MDPTIQMILQQLIGATPQRSPLAALEGTAVDPYEDQGAKAQRIQELMGGSASIPKALQNNPYYDVTVDANGNVFYKRKGSKDQWIQYQRK